MNLNTIDMIKVKKEEMIGKKFGRGIVIECVGLRNINKKNKRNRLFWKCLCECGNYYEASTTGLRSKNKQSCGCLQRDVFKRTVAGNEQFLMGKRFSRGIVIRDLGLTDCKPYKGRIMKKHLWELQCDCGEIYQATTSNLNNGGVQSCGCLRLSQLNLLGNKYGKVTIIKKLDTIGEGDNKKQMWEGKCECGTIISKTSAEFKRALSCGCLGTLHSEEFNKPIKPEKYFNDIKNGAKGRDFKFEVTFDEIMNLLKLQDFKCKLSGWPIDFITSSISLDRIDSSKDYTLDNVQWLHRNINLLKNKWKEQDFIDACRSVAQTNPKKE